MKFAFNMKTGENYSLPEAIEKIHELEKQNKQMYEALKEAYAELRFHDWHNCRTGLEINSLLKELES